ncbi:SNF2 family helicase/ATPase [Trichophyton rubrum]|uniref:SNF2 family helicase/ATPase n=3 Tax=Trichophyton TaxID=5550 RepID=A0A178F3S1_TRIRU|nr:SNF2 family helicase/ATPase [Trichophyton rubrum]
MATFKQEENKENIMEVDINKKSEEEEDDDMEGLGMKAKALTKLLQTSSVFVAIMADKMKEQQKKQQEQAKRQATKEKNLAEKQQATAASTNKRSTRASEKKAPADASKEARDTQGKKPSSTKLPTRGSSGKATKASKGDITNYFKQAKAEVAEDKPTVQEALAQAADEFEAKPSALGEQEDLIATQQPSLVTGGKMRKYQLEGLEWMKSLWMNGLCGILADEMGLGKTVQAISLIAFFKEHNIPGPFLIAAPLSTVSNWVNEFARWTPSINTVLYHGTKEQRSEIRRKQMKNQDQRAPDFPVVCTSYEICMNDRKFLANYQWKYIIVDEGHRLKNMNCKLIKELLTYPSANRLLITGTPLQNNIAELWSLLHFLLPEIFNDLDNFQSWFDFSSVLDDSDQNAVNERRRRNLVSTMHAILKPFLLRRVKTDVESSLPKKREYVLYAPLTPEQKELYVQIVNGTSRQYLEEKAAERIEARNGSEKQSRARSLKRGASGSELSTPNKSAKSSRDSTPTRARRRGRSKNYKEESDRDFNSKLARLEKGIQEETPEESELSEGEMDEIERAKTMKLAKKEISSKKLQNPVMQARLVCNSPLNFYWPWGEDSGVDSTLITSSGKMLLLDRLVPCLISKGHKVLIFSQFKGQLDILEDWATQLRSWNCCRIDGAIAQADRQEQINAFNNDPDYRIFLLSTRAGGQGINLTAADTVILFDSDWNPQQDLQAQDRAHRIGQTKPVIVYRLATRGTIEQTLLERAGSKRRLEKLVIQKGKFKSLLDSTSSSNPQRQADELKKIFGDEDIEVFDIGAETTSESLLSEKDLQILTDRSDEAYSDQRMNESGRAFAAVKANTDADEIMADITSK